MDWLKEKIGDILRQAWEKLKKWWDDFSWIDAIVAVGLTLIILPFQEISLLLSAPIFLVGIPQFDILLGILAWLGTCYLWFWIREVALVLLWLAAIRMSQVIRKAVRNVLGYHKTHGYWWMILVTMPARIVWDLLGAYGSKLLWRIVVTPIEERMKANSPKESFIWRRNRIKPRTRTVDTKNSLPPLSLKQPKVGKLVVENHLTPIGTIKTKEELVEAQATFLKTGKIPKGYRLHSDIRLVTDDGKVYSFAFPKATRDESMPVKTSQVFNSTKGHGTKLQKNVGIPAGQKGAVYIPSLPDKRAYGHGMSWVVSEDRALYWADGNLHIVRGADTFVVIQTTNGLLAFKKDPKLPSYRKEVKGRTWDFKDASRDADLGELLINNPELDMELKYPDHFHVLKIDKKGNQRLYSRRPAIRNGKDTDMPIDKSMHVPGLTFKKVPKKYWDSEIELGLYLDKDLPAAEAEQMGAAILNSHPAEAVAKQAKSGEFKAKIFRFRKLNGKDLSEADWATQRALVEKASQEVRPQGKLTWHVPKKFPKDAKLRRKALRQLERDQQEGVVFKDRKSLKSWKYKFLKTSDRRIVGVKPIKSDSKKGAGALLLEDGSTVNVRYVPVPGLYEDPSKSTDAFRDWALKHQDSLVGLIAEIEHEDTPDGQKLQTPKLMAIRRGY